jgi:hypothetical protein
MDAVMRHLCDPATTPQSPLGQLCAASIIRDEHIASLSLDMKEGDRYALLCDAIGATDADAWIDRGSKLASAARRRFQAAEREVQDAVRQVAAASRRVDELRAGLVEEGTVAAAAARLQTFIARSLPPDQLAEPARIAIAERSRQLEDLIWLKNAWGRVADADAKLVELRSAVRDAENARFQAEATLAALEENGEPEPSSGSVAKRARDLDALVALGRDIGLHVGHCPLCASNITHAEFENGLAAAAAYAKQLDERAVELASRERARQTAREALQAAEEEVARQQ